MNQATEFEQINFSEPSATSESVHVTAIKNGAVWGHQDDHCDEAGCAAGADLAYSDVDPETVEIGHVYEITDGKVTAEIE